MVRLYDDEQLDEIRRGYLGSKLFGTLFPGLAFLERMYGELSPTQIWEEADVFCAQKLMGVEALEIEVVNLYNTLLRRYKMFIAPNGEQITRTDRQAEYTTVCVLTCVNFRLVAMPDEDETYNSKEAIMELLNLIGSHPVHIHLYKAQRQREIKLDDAGMKIERNPWLKEEKVKKTQTKKKHLTDQELMMEFSKLFLRVDFARWMQVVNTCEAEMTFNSKIDRIAYLVLANHEHWLKAPRTMKLAAYVKLMNAILGKDKHIQQSEASRKFNDMKNEAFYDSLLNMNQTYDYESEHISKDFFRTLKENVKLMHGIVNKIKES